MTANQIARLVVKIESTGVTKVAAQIEMVDTAGRKAGKSTDDLDRRVKRLGQSASGASGGITSLSSAVGVLGGGFGKLAGTALVLAPALLAVSGAAVAIGAALAPLVGLAGAAAVGLSAFAQAASVVALASMGVGDALKEQMQAAGKAGKAASTGADQQRSAARAISAAQDGVRQAHEGVRNATESLTRAEQARAQALKALGPAQAQARRDLEDMHAALAGAMINERQAVQTASDAWKALGEAQNPVDVDRLADAQAGLTASTLNEQRAVRSLVDARQALEDLMKPADALTVADAQDAVSDATRGETRAALQLAKARAAAEKAAADPAMSDADKAQAKLDLADAENAVGDASRASAHAQQQLTKLQAGPDPREVAKAKQNIADAEQGVADATAATAKAQKDVQDASKGADPAAVAKAQLDVAAATQALTDATRDRARLQKDVAAADKAGVDGSAGVIAARERIADADREIVDAQRKLVGANRDVAKAMQAVKDAQVDARAAAAGLAAANVDLNEKFNDLPPAAQAFVRVLQGLKPKLDDLRATAAAGLFPGVTAGLQSAMGSFDSVKKVTGETASVLGGLAKRAGELVGSSGFGKDLETIGHRNAIIIDRLGRAAIYVGDAFRHLLVAAGPLTTWLAKVTLEWAKNVDGAAKAGRESGKLADFFQKTRNTLIRVASIVGNLGEAFFNVGKAAAPFGRDMLESIDKVAKRFNEWTESVGGQKSLQDFFRQSRDLAGQLMPAIGGILKSLGTLSFSVLPAYVKILQVLGPLAGPLVQAFILYKVALTGATVALNLARAAQSAYTAVTKGGIVYTAAAKVATIAMSAATKAWAGAQWLLNAALTANPIGLVVVGIAALVAGFVVAYQKSETFRNIVNGALNAVKDVAVAVFGWISENWKLLAGILLGPFGVVLAAVKTFGPDIVAGIKAGLSALGSIFVDPLVAAWNWVLDFFGVHSPSKLFAELGGNLIAGLVNGLKAALSALLGAAKWVGEQLVAGVKAYVGAYKDLGGWLLDQVVAGFKAVTSGIVGVGGWVKNRIGDGIDATAEAVKGFGGNLLGWIVTGFKATVDGIVGVGGWIKNRIGDGIDLFTDAFKGLGGNPIKWIVEGIKAYVELTTGVGGWIKNRLNDGLDAAKDGFTGLGGNIIGWIVDGLKKGAFELQGFLNKIIDVINKIPGVDIGHIDVLKKDSKGNVTGFARGGAYGATGGMIDRPMALFGEEAPAHREWVIPENPAYRGRAQKLAMAAAAAVGVPGFAEGGVVDAFKGAIKNTHAGPKSSLALFEAGIVESGLRNLPYGDRDSRGALQIRDSTAGPMGINNMDPLASAVAFLTRGFWGKGGANAIAASTGNSAGWVAQQTQGSAFPDRYDQVAEQARKILGGSGGGGIFDKIAGAVGGAVNSVADVVGGIVSKLPGPGDLPDWLKGTGSYVLDHVKDWIGDKVKGIFGGGDSVSGVDVPSGPSGVAGLGMFDGRQVAKWIIPELQYARDHGWGGHITSGYRPPGQVVTGPVVAPQGMSEHQGTQYPHGAVDFGGAFDAAGLANKQAFIAATAGYAGHRLLSALGFRDDGHMSGTGHYKGGIYGGSGLLGSFETGTPYVPQTGPYLLHRGEAVTSAGENRPDARGGGPLVHIEHATFSNEEDVETFARRLGWQLAR